MRIYDPDTGRLDIDLMIELAKTDPETLEREREEVLAYAISRARSDRQKQLKQLCFRRAVELRKYKHPIAALGPLRAQLAEDLETFSHALRGRDIRTSHAEKKETKATILSFPNNS